MKNIILILALCLPCAAQTNTNTNNVTLSLESTNEVKGMPMELTLGGSGFQPKSGDSSYDLAFTFSAQLLKLPIWFGIAQEVGWDPVGSGATDLYADWTMPVLNKLFDDKLYLNTGWSFGAVYGSDPLGWRSGPEVSLEYYTSGNALIFAGINYDMITKDSRGWQVSGKSSGLRFSIGIGISF